MSGPGDVSPLRRGDQGGNPIPEETGLRPWTADYSNLFPQMPQTKQALGASFAYRD